MGIFKNVLVFLCLTAIFLGCSSPVRYRLSKDYLEKTPKTVVVLPVRGEAQDAKARAFIRDTTVKRLKDMDYGVLSTSLVDGVYSRLGTKGFETMSPGGIAELFQVDSVLYLNVTEWDESLFLTYASLDLGMEFILYARDGSILWRAGYSTGESEMKFDRTAMELGVIKAYEPRIERIINSMFFTLPRAQEGVEEEQEKRFFDWL